MQQCISQETWKNKSKAYLQLKITHNVFPAPFVRFSFSNLSLIFKKIIKSKVILQRRFQHHTEMAQVKALMFCAFLKAKLPFLLHRRYNLRRTRKEEGRARCVFPHTILVILTGKCSHARVCVHMCVCIQLLH